MSGAGAGRSTSGLSAQGLARSGAMETLEAGALGGLKSPAVYVFGGLVNRKGDSREGHKTAAGNLHLSLKVALEGPVEMPASGPRSFNTV